MGSLLHFVVLPYIAAPIPEIRSLKLQKYARCNYEKMGEVFRHGLLLQRTRGKHLGALANQTPPTAAGEAFSIISSVAAMNQVDHHFKKQAYSEQHSNGSLLTPLSGHL